MGSCLDRHDTIYGVIDYITGNRCLQTAKCDCTQGVYMIDGTLVATIVLDSGRKYNMSCELFMVLLLLQSSGKVYEYASVIL